MSDSNNLESIVKLAEAAVEDKGLKLVAAKFSQQGRSRTLEVTIHRPHGHITIEDCEEISKAIENALDNQDPPLITGSFLLEVLSPGIDRQLKTEREYTAFSGQEVDILSREKIGDLGFSLRGTLLDFNNGRLVIGNARAVEEKKKREGKKAHLHLVTNNLDRIEIDMSQLISVKLHPSQPEKPVLRAVPARGSTIDDN